MVSIRGVDSGLYLGMNSKGELYGSVSTHLVVQFALNHLNSNTNSIKLYSYELLCGTKRCQFLQVMASLLGMIGHVKYVATPAGGVFMSNMQCINVLGVIFISHMANSLCLSLS